MADVADAIAAAAAQAVLSSTAITTAHTPPTSRLRARLLRLLVDY